MTKLNEFYLSCAAILVGMTMIVLFDNFLRWYEWTMLALGGNFR